jgi:hypothetical protein
MISWRGVAKKRREPKLGWMKLKSSGTVAPKQQSWPESNHFVSNWYSAVTVTPLAHDQKSRPKESRPKEKSRSPATGPSFGISAVADEGENQRPAGADIPPP